MAENRVRNDRSYNRSGRGALLRILLAVGLLAVPLGFQQAAWAAPGDADDDGVADSVDLDDDNDGLLDSLEMRTGTPPTGVTAARVGPSFFSGITTNIVPVDQFWAGTPESTIDGNTGGGVSIGSPLPFGPVPEPFVPPRIFTITTTGPLTASALLIYNDLGVSNDGVRNFDLDVYDVWGNVILSQSYVAPGSLSTYTATFPATLTNIGSFRVSVRDTPPGGGGYAGALQIREFGLIGDYSAPLPSDADGDGISDHLDIDSDNDGIPDNVEAQTTAGYRAPIGDSDDNGLDDAYEVTPGAGTGLTPVDSDADGTEDILDLDSDGDGIVDLVESGLGIIDADNNGRTDSPVGINGLDNTAEAADTYADPSGEAWDAGVFLLADSDGDVPPSGAGAVVLVKDLDYRDKRSDCEIGTGPDGQPQSLCDYGDLPDSGPGTSAGNYQTLSGDGYAAHNPVGIQLGATRTSEAEAAQNSTATGDSGDDGVSLTRILPSVTSLSVPVVVQNRTATSCLVGFLDQNGDGDFADAGEVATKISNIAANGTFNLSFAGLTAANFTSGSKKALRVRVSSDTAFCALAASAMSTGYAANGEIEDYILPVERQVNMEVVKSLLTPSSGTIVPGQAVSYRVVAKNLGPDTVIAPGVVISDSVPAGLTGTWACVGAGGATCPATSGANLNVTATTIAVNGTLTFTYTGTASASLGAGTITNTATATVGSTMNDPVLSNNSSSIVTGVQTQADLSVGKTPASQNVVAGNDATWTISMTNAGPHAAENATLTDVLPAGTSLVSLTTGFAGATCDEATFSCTVPSLAVGATLSATVVATVSSSTTAATLTNRTSATSVATDATPGNNTASAVANVSRSSDLAITKGDIEATPGLTATYPVTVSNLGPSDAASVVVTDNVPSGLTFNAGASSSVCSEAAGVVTCSVGTVPAGASVALALAFDVAASLTAAVDNTATVTSASSDPDPSNNSSTGTATLTSSADLSVVKQPDQAIPVAGAPVGWTITVSNTGPSAAQNVQLIDAVPAATTGVAATVTSGAAGTCNVAGNDVTCDWGTIAPGSNSVVHVTGTLSPTTPEGTELVNSATVTSSTTDPTGSNNTSTGSGTTITDIDLEVDKSVAPSTVSAGETAVFTITVHNTGLSTATDVRVADLLPAGVAIDGTVTADGGSCTGEVPVLCAAATLDADATMTIEIPVRIGADVAAGPLSNSATIEAAGQTPAVVRTELNVTRGANLGLAKTVSPSPANAGESLTWTLTVNNAGPSDANSVVVTDTLPAGLVFVSSPDGCTAAAATITCSTAALSVGGSAEFQVLTALDPAMAAGPATNSASVRSNELDPDESDNTDSASGTVDQLVDLELVSAALDSSVTAGSIASVLLTVTNHGPSTARGIVIVTTLPAGTTFNAGASDPACSAVAQLVTCTLPSATTIAPDGSIQLIVAATVAPATASGTLLAFPSEVSGSTPETVLSNNEDTATIGVNTDATLVISKTHDGQPVVAGAPTSWTVNVANTGPSVALDTIVTDTLAPGLTFVPYDVASPGTTSDERCSAAGSVVTCDLGTLAVGSTAIRIVALTDPTLTAAFSNAASVTTSTPGSCDVADPQPSCTATAGSVTPSVQANVAVTKTLLTDPIVPGADVRYLITVANSGPSVATGILATDELPAGLTFVAHDGADAAGTSSPGCDASGQTVTCSLAQLGVGQLQWTIVAATDPLLEGTLTNTVSVTTATGGSCTTLSPCTSTVGPSAVVPAADVVVTKTLESPELVAGETARWKISVVNNGPSTARDVAFTDLLDPSLALELPLDPRCTFANDEVTCTIGDLPAGSTDEIILLTTVLDSAAEGTQVSNTVLPTTSTVDPDPGCPDCTAGPFAVAQKVDLALAISGSSTGYAGTEATYTVTVTNNGPSDATGVIASVDLPAGFTGVTGTWAAGACTFGPDASCELGDLAVGDSVEITVVLAVGSSVTAGTVSTVSASVTSPATEIDLLNNDDAVDTTVSRNAGITATKGVNAARIVAGTTATYTIDVANAGPSVATAVTVSDEVPASLTNLTVSPVECSLAEHLVTCEFDEVAPGAALTVTIQGDLPADTAPGTEIVNTATVACGSGECATVEPSVEFVTARESDLVTTKTSLTPELVAGQNASFEISVLNDGPSIADPVTVTDELAPGLTYVAAGSDPRCSAVESLITCNLGTMGVGSTDSVVIVVALAASITAGTEVSNTATTTSPSVDPDPSCDACTTTPQPVTAVADLQLTKSVASSDATAGTNVEWTLSVHNAGPSDAQSVVVSDVLPVGLSFVSVGSDSRCAAVNGVVTCDLATVANGETIDLVLVTMVGSDVADGASLDNAATVSSPTPDPDESCESCGAAVTVNRVADLVTTKTLVTDPVVAGDRATYEIAVRNVGPSDAANVVVTDPLNEWLAYSAAGSDPECAASGTGVECTLAVLAAASTHTFTVSVDIDPSTPVDTVLINTVGVTSETVDPDGGCPGCTSTSTPVGTVADLELSASASTNVVAGTDATIQLSATNHGPSDSAGTTITWTLPAGVTFVSSTGAVGGCSADGQVVTCDLAVLAVEAVTNVSLVVHIDASVAAGSSLVGNGVVAGDADETDVDNNSASTTQTVLADAGVTMTKDVSAATVVAGESFTYTLNVSNSGPSDAADVQIVDTMPSGVTAVGVTPSTACAIAANEVTCEFASIPDGGVEHVVISAVLAENVADGSAVTNTAVLSCADGCETVEPSVTLTADRQADIVTTKSQTTTPLVAGRSATWSIEVTNNGPSTAASVTITDELLSIFSFDAAGSDSRCAASGQTVTCDLGDLADGAVEIVTIAATIDPAADAGTMGANAVDVTSPTVDPAPSCPGCSIPGTPVVTEADLVMTKTAGAEPAIAGANTTWTLSVVNNGPSVARNVVLIDTLDPRLTFVAVGSDTRCGLSGGAVRCVVGDLDVDAGDSVAIVTRIAADVASGTTVANTMSVESETVDPDGSCAECTATINVDTSADISMTKTLVTDPVVAGRNATWRLTVRNGGPSDATDVVVSDELASGLTFVGGLSSSWCAETSGTVSCALGSVASGQTVVIDIVTAVSADLDQDSVVSNSATVTSETVDPEPGCPDCTATGTVDQVSEVWVAKSGSTQVVAGVPATWTIQFGNRGPSTANDVRMVDTLPPGLSSVSVDAPNDVDCAVADDEIVCTAPSVAPGTDRTVIVTATPNASLATGTTLTNAASVTAPSDPYGSSPSTVTSTVARASGLTVQKVPDQAVFTAGEAVGWTITVTNPGPSDVSGAVVTDAIPAGVIGAAVDHPNCEIADGEVSCTLDLAADAEPIEIRVTGNLASSVIAPDLENSATVSCPGGECEPSTASTSSAVDRRADLVWSKSAADESVTAGSTMTFELSVRNDGPSDAFIVTATDELAPGLSFVADESDDRCQATGQTVICGAATVVDGGSTTWTVVVAVDPAFEADSITNSVTGTSLTPDPEPGCADCTAGPIPVERSADLEVVKTLDDAALVSGTTSSYTITVTNHGPSDATGVVIRDALASGLVFDPAGSPGCGMVSGQVECVIGSVASGASVTRTIAVGVDAAIDAATLTNTVTVTTETPDPQPECPDCTTTNPVLQQADLNAVKEFIGTEFIAGTVGRWQVTLTNRGPGVAPQAAVQDRLDDRLTFDPTTSSPGCTANGQLVTCTSATLTVGESAVFTIGALLAADAPAGTVVENSVTPTSPVPDPEPECTTCSAVSPPVSAHADLVTAISSPSTAVAGQRGVATVTVVNNGPSVAAGSVVRIAVPRELVESSGGEVSASTPAGPCALEALVLVCPIGDRRVGEAIDIMVDYTVPPSFDPKTALVLTATASTESTDTNLGNNAATSTIEVDRIAGVSVQKSASTALPVAGGSIEWTILITNAGSSDASEVTILDDLPEAVAEATVADERCALDGRSLTCTLAELAAGESVELKVRATLAPSTPDGSPVVNSVSVACGDDSCEPTTSEVVVTARGGADLSLTKTGEGSIVPGFDYTWTLSVNNAGPSDAVDAVITDRLPDGLEAVAGSLPNNCEVQGQVVTCEAGTIGVGEEVSVEIVTAVDPNLDVAELTNAASVLSEVIDPSEACEACAATVPVTNIAGLELTKVPVTSTVEPGGVAKWKIAVTNLGPGTSKSAVLSDPILEGLTFVGAEGAECALRDAAVYCELGDVAARESRTVTISARVDLEPGESVRNVAVVESPTIDPDTGEPTKKSVTADPVAVAEPTPKAAEETRSVPQRLAERVTDALADTGFAGLAILTLAAVFSGLGVASLVAGRRRKRTDPRA